MRKLYCGRKGTKKTENILFYQIFDSRWLMAISKKNEQNLLVFQFSVLIPLCGLFFLAARHSATTLLYALAPQQQFSIFSFSFSVLFVNFAKEVFTSSTIFL